MKYTNLLGILSLFIACQSHASITIRVTTLADENGENPDKCSLREAIASVNTLTAIGGCRAGDRYLDNIILLGHGNHILTHGELVITRKLIISGLGTADNTQIDPITRTKPKRMLPDSEVSGSGNHRLFNTLPNFADITLKNMIVSHGNADKGGVLLAGGLVSFDNLIARQNQASIAGGVVYLEGLGTSIGINGSTLENNTADNGAVMAMSCIHHLSPAAHVINIARSSIINNGAAGNNSILEVCGKSSLSLDTSTVAKNTAKTTGGIINLTNNIDPESTVNINQSTLIENNIAPVFFYNTLASINMLGTVIAFNNGLGCLQQATTNDSPFVGSSNVFQNVYPTCPQLKNDKSSATDLDAESNVSFSNEFNNLGYYGGLTQTYLPKTTSLYILNKGSASCLANPDQRGSDSRYLDESEKCDVGAVERRVATTVYDKSVFFSNKAYTDRISELTLLNLDIPSETDNTDDVPNARGEFKKDAANKYIIQLLAGTDVCSIVQPTDDTGKPVLRFDNGGKIMEIGTEKTCIYRFQDTNGNFSNKANIRFRTDNQGPYATDDSYNLPIGESRILLDLIANDNDSGDGKYGKLCTDDTAKCNGVYIKITSQPKSGVIEAEKTGKCPALGDELSTCLGGKIYYRASNTLAPFDDKFTYVVYDTDKTSSNEATVTIINQQGAAESSSGSMGAFSVIALAGLGFYRRFRKPYVV